MANLNASDSSSENCFSFVEASTYTEKDWLGDADRQRLPAAIDGKLPASYSKLLRDRWDAFKHLQAVSVSTGLVLDATQSTAPSEVAIESMSISDSDGRQYGLSSSSTKTAISSLASSSTDPERKFLAKELGEQLLRDAERRFNPLPWRLETSAEVSKLCEDIAGSTDAKTWVKAVETSQEKAGGIPSSARSDAMEKAISELGKVVVTAFREHSFKDGSPASSVAKAHFVWRGKKPVSDVRTVVQGRVLVQANIFACDQDPSNKPDVIVSRANPEERYLEAAYSWREVDTTIEAKLDTKQDLGDKVLEQNLRYARGVMLSHPMTVELYTLTVCGPRLRLWRFNPLCYSTSRAVNLLESTAEALAMLAFMASSAARTVWQPSPDIIPDRRPLEWKLLSAANGRSMWGRRPTCWSADIADKAIIVKATFLPRHLLGHEEGMLKLVTKMSNRPTSLPEDLHAITYDGFRTRPWKRHKSHPAITATRSEDGEVEDLTFSLTVTHHTLGETITVHPFNINSQVHLISLHKQLFEDLYLMAQAGIHYRDIHMGNILRAKSDPGKLVIIDFDRARHNMKPRGTLGKRDDFTEIVLDDARSADLACAPLAYGNCRQLEAELNAAYNAIKIAEENANTAYASKGAQRVELLRKRMAKTQHRYIDDLESAVFLHVLQIAHSYDQALGRSDKALFGGVIAKFAVPAEKKEIWSADDNWLFYLFECFPNLSVNWLDLLRNLRDTIFEARSKIDQGQHTLEELKPLLPEEKDCFQVCIRLLDEHLQSLRPSAEELPDKGSGDSSAGGQKEVGGTEKTDAVQPRYDLRRPVR